MKAAVAESGAGNLIPYGTTFQQFGAQFAQKLGCAVTDVSVSMFLLFVVLLSTVG